MFGLSGLYIKLIGGLLVAIMVAGLVADRGRWMHRAHGAEDQLAVTCTAVRTASNRPKLDCKQMAAQIQFVGDALNAVVAQRNAAMAADKAHAIEVESNQNAVSKESENDYDKKIADVRAYYASLLRNAGHQSTANSGSSGSKNMSGASTATSGASKAANENELPSPDALIATEQAIQLQSILGWGKKVGITK